MTIILFSFPALAMAVIFAVDFLRSEAVSL
jgi:hypothetical protein